MTITMVEGKTKYVSDIITLSYADVQTLCKMVDKRDEIINDANKELLKRGCRISALEQTSVEVHAANKEYADEHARITLMIEAREGELKCLKAAKDKTDAENTRLLAFDKSETHRKYEELHSHHLYEVGSLNDTIDNMCKSMRELKTSCAEKDRHIEMLGSVEFEADDDGVHITYTVG